MTPSEFDAVTAIELAIVASEGDTTVDGVDYHNLQDATTARHKLAVRAVTEASLLCRLIAIRPPCAWCGCEIGPDDDTVLFRGRRLHNTPSRPCAREHDTGVVDPYEPDRRTPMLWLVRGR